MWKIFFLLIMLLHLTNDISFALRPMVGREETYNAMADIMHQLPGLQKNLDKIKKGEIIKKIFHEIQKNVAALEKILNLEKEPNHKDLTEMPKKESNNKTETMRKYTADLSEIEKIIPRSAMPVDAEGNLKIGYPHTLESARLMAWAAGRRGQKADKSYPMLEAEYGVSTGQIRNVLTAFEIKPLGRIKKGTPPSAINLVIAEIERIIPRSSIPIDVEGKLKIEYPHTLELARLMAWAAGRRGQKADKTYSTLRNEFKVSPDQIANVLRVFEIKPLGRTTVDPEIEKIIPRSAMPVDEKGNLKIGYPHTLESARLMAWAAGRRGQKADKSYPMLEAEYGVSAGQIRNVLTAFEIKPLGRIKKDIASPTKSISDSDIRASRNYL